jgi:DNA-binding LacI/PurR family transcriptional regulator
LNIHELAKHLKISIGTVSRALNGKADVNAKTRQRVIEAAQKFGYSPNQSGRSLRQGTTGLVGFMVIINRERDTRGEAFFMSIFDGMQSFLAGRGLDLVVHFCGSDEDPVAYLRRIVERRLVDGIVISQMHRTDKRIDFLVQRKMPFIAFGRSHSSKEFSWMDLDFEGVAEKAINHLYLLGHRRIAIATSSNDINFGYLFIDSCRSSLAKRGITLPDDLVLREPLTESGGYRVGERILAMEQRPTGVVLVDNTMAIGLYHIFQETKIIPGKDISIVGFDESPNGEFLRPSLTQFEVPLGQLGRWLGEHIVLLIDAKSGGKKVPHFAKTWPMKMILGDSSGPAS